jgi:hypothetical protein
MRVSGIHSFLARVAFALSLAFAAGAVSAQAERQLAPGFTALARSTTIALMPTDVELFSMSAGGVLEPQAVWTTAANRHLRSALEERFQADGRRFVVVPESALTDETAELNALFGAVASAISFHHWVALGKLPSKDGKLDWTLGEGTQAIAKATGAQYGLFVWMRDSYASAERKAMIVGMALLGIGLAGGAQFGYAALVDLQTGRVVWFNQMASGFGDMREIAPARDTVRNLLSGLPTQAP